MIERAGPSPIQKGLCAERSSFSDSGSSVRCSIEPFEPWAHNLPTTNRQLASTLIGRQHPRTRCHQPEGRGFVRRRRGPPPHSARRVLSGRCAVRPVGSIPPLGRAVGIPNEGRGSRHVYAMGHRPSQMPTCQAECSAAPHRWCRPKARGSAGRTTRHRGFCSNRIRRRNRA